MRRFAVMVKGSVVDADVSDADEILCFSEHREIAARVAECAARCTRSKMYVLSIPGGRMRYVSRTRFPRVARLLELLDVDRIRVDLEIGPDVFAARVRGG